MIIYKTTNLINNKIYIGQDVNNNPKYLGSGTSLLNAIKKYGKTNFKKEILEKCSDTNHLNEREQYWIKEFDSTNRKTGYNISFGGQLSSWKGLKHTEESKEKIRQANLGKEPWNKGKHNIYTGETKKKMSRAKLGNKIWLGKNHSDKTKKKLANINTGKKLSDETKKKISNSNLGRVSWLKGKNQSDKVKQKIAQTLTKKIFLVKNDEVIKIFNTSSEAAIYFNVSIKTIGNYCRLKNEKNKLRIIYQNDYEKTK